MTSATDTLAREQPDSVCIPPLGLEGLLGVPRVAEGIVLFAHGTGSSSRSPRNNQVAAALREADLATLLFDLLTPEEAADRRKLFDIDLLAERLLLAADWVAEAEATRHLRIGYFGASTGAAAALVASARGRRPVGAIVSRGGRPDLAGETLPEVKAPTLLIVGGLDVSVLDLNRLALAELRCTKDLKIVPVATHLFEEPGALEEVTALARGWFLGQLATARQA